MTAPPIDCPPQARTTLAAGIRQFNSGAYFTCHETLEDLWLDEPGELRSLYQGILQLGVGLLHLQRGNAAGACSLLERGGQLVAPFAPVACGYELAPLLAAAGRIRKCLERQGLAAAQALLAQDPPRIAAAAGN